MPKLELKKKSVTNSKWGKKKIDQAIPLQSNYRAFCLLHNVMLLKNESDGYEAKLLKYFEFPVLLGIFVYSSEVFCFRGCDIFQCVTL